MQISTTARHCELEPSVREFARTRLEKFERFARDIHEAHLIVTAEKYRHTAEITLKLNQHEMVSREISTDARAAIDLAADRLESQLRKLKEKRTKRNHAGLSADERARLNGGVPVDGADDVNGEG